MNSKLSLYVLYRFDISVSKGDVGVGGFKGEAGPKGEPVRFRSNSQTDADRIINPDLPLIQSSCSMC